MNEEQQREFTSARAYLWQHKSSKIAYISELQLGRFIKWCMKHKVNTISPTCLKCFDLYVLGIIGE